MAYTGEGVKKSEKFADIPNERPLNMHVLILDCSSTHLAEGGAKRLGCGHVALLQLREKGDAVNVYINLSPDSGRRHQ